MSSWLKLSFKRRDYHEFTGVADAHRINWNECDISEILGIFQRCLELKDENFAAIILDGLIQQIQNDPSLKSKLADTSIANTLDSMLNQSMSSSNVSLKILRTILTLLTEEKCRKKFSSPSLCYRLVKVCHLHKEEESLIVHGLRIMYALTGESSNEQVASKLMVSGGCELISSIIHQYHSSDNELVEWSCRIIYNMCYDHVACSEKFGDIGVCEMAVSIISSYHEKRYFRDDEAHSLNQSNKSRTSHYRKFQHILLAIGSICRQNDMMKEKLSNLNIADIVLQVFESYQGNPHRLSVFLQDISMKMGKLHDDDMTFIETLLWSISNLCYPCERNQIRFSELGFCSVVVKILSQQTDSEKCVIECLRCIRNLGHDCDSSLISLHSSGTLT
jgi:hypothetical protein